MPSVVNQTPITFSNFDYSPDIEQQICDIHRAVAPTPAAFDLIYTHCRIVGRMAMDCIDFFAQKNQDLILARSAQNPDDNTVDMMKKRAYIGGLVHDIGVYKVLNSDGYTVDRPRYLLHGLEGYRLLLDTGFTEEIAQFARNHTGVGITREDIRRQHLPLPPADYIPQTIEQEAVMYADNFNTKHRPLLFVSQEAARQAAERFGADNLARFNRAENRYGIIDISRFAHEYGLGIKGLTHE